MSYQNAITVLPANILAGALPTGVTVTNANIVAAAAIAISKLQAPTVTAFQPANPTGTSSLSLVMMGLGGTVTLTSSRTAKLLVFVMGYALSDTVGDGCALVVRYGTGTAPINGAATTGTAVFAIPASAVNFDISNVGTTRTPFTLAGYFDNSANLNVATWFDIALTARTAGTASLKDLQFQFAELSN